MTKTYETVLLSRLIPYANNPRKNDDAIPAVEASIEQVIYPGQKAVLLNG